MTALEPLLDPADDTIADLVAVLANVAALKDVVAEREGSVRDRLAAAVGTEQDRIGGHFTGRFPAGMVYTSGGNAKPTVRDRDALASWLADEEPDLIAWRDTVEVVDHAEAAAIINLCGTSPGQSPEDEAAWVDALVTLASRCLRVVRTPIYATDVVDVLLGRGYTVAGDYVVHDATGQPLPGVEVTYTRETLTVKPSKAVRDSVAARLRGQLAALPAGGAR